VEEATRGVEEEVSGGRGRRTGAGGGEGQTGVNQSQSEAQDRQRFLQSGLRSTRVRQERTPNGGCEKRACLQLPYVHTYTVPSPALSALSPPAAPPEPTQPS
jgi:hypothetical protein